MGSLKGARPSPAIVVAILALVAGVTGAAVAQPTAKKAVTKKKVKKIATKQINKLAPGLSVASADTAGNANTVGGKPASAFASKTSEPYRQVDTPGQPQFQNGWDNFAIPGTNESKAAFYKDSLGVVHLKGTFFKVPGTGTAFTLPSGYRPSETLTMPISNISPMDPAAAVLFVGANGELSPDCGAAGGCSIGVDGLTFRAQH